MRPFLVSMLFFWALISYGQQALIPNLGQLPTVPSPSIPNPQYDLLRSQQQNIRIVEQDICNYEKFREAYKELRNDNDFSVSKSIIITPLHGQLLGNSKIRQIISILDNG